MAFNIGSITSALGSVGSVLGAVGNVASGFQSVKNIFSPAKAPAPVVQQTRFTAPPVPPLPPRKPAQPTGAVPGQPWWPFGGSSQAGCRTMTNLRYINEVRKSQDPCAKNITYKALMEMARWCGLVQTAENLGVTTEVVCNAIMERPRRRARGISAADLRRTRSTIRKIAGMRKDLRALAR